MHCFMRNQGGLKRQNLEQILLTSTDGMSQKLLPNFLYKQGNKNYKQYDILNFLLKW